MAVSNLERVGRGLTLLKDALAPYILRELKGQYKARWWKDGVENALRGNIGRDAASATLTDDQRYEKLDIQALLAILWENWNSVFQSTLGHSGLDDPDSRLGVRAFLFQKYGAYDARIP